MLNYNRRTDFWVFTLITLVAYFLVRRTLFVGFNIDDDHQFISMANANNRFKDYGGNWAQFMLYQVSWFNGGRFFPLLTAIIFFKAKTIGSHYLTHHLVIFFSGVISAFFIYKIFKIKNISTINSLIGAFVFYTGNEYGEIFWRLICGEGPGILFFLIGLYYTLKYFNLKTVLSLTFSLGFLTLATLTKESFILLMPLAFVIPLVGSKHWEEAKQTILNHKKIYIAASSIFLSLIIAVALMLLNAEKMFDYGSPISMPATIKNNLYFVVKWFFPFLPFVGLALLFVFKSKSFKIPLHFFLLSVCWILVHIIIYHKVIISFSMGKYIMPGGLIFIGLLVYSLESIKLNSKLLYKISLILLCFILIRNAKITYIIANEYAAKVSSFNKLIDTAIAMNEQRIAIYGGNEFYSSVESHFKIKGYFPTIYSSKVLKQNNIVKSKYQNDEFEDAMFASLGLKYPTKTLRELGQDSLLKILIVAEPIESQEINENVINQFFPFKSVIDTKFSNPKLTDMFQLAFWEGNLNNDKVSYAIYKK